MKFINIITTALFVLLVIAFGVDLFVKNKSTSGDKIWASFLADPGVARVSMKQKELLKPCIMDLPAMLGGLMNAKASLVNVLTAKLLVYKYLLANGYIDMLIDLIPKEQLDEAGGSKNVKALLKKGFDELIEQTEAALPHIEEALSKNNISDSDILIRMGLNQTNNKALLEGKLTISDILLSQPYIIIM